MQISDAYQMLFNIVLVMLLLLIGAALIRSVLRKGGTDRILSVNMISTMVISAVAILSVKLGESYLCDVALIYAMISFLSVLMLTSMSTPAHSSRRKFYHEQEALHHSSVSDKTEGTSAEPALSSDMCRNRHTENALTKDISVQKSVRKKENAKK